MKRLLILILLILSFNLRAQTNTQWLSFYSGVTITSFAQEGKYIWAGTTGGLIKIDTTSGSITRFNRNNSDIPGTHINFILIDKSNKKWIGTESAGVACFDGNKWIIFNESNSLLPSNTVQCAVADKDGNIWLGTNFGLVIYNGNKIDTVHNVNSHLNIVSMAIDKDGNIWMASFDKGAFKFDGNTLTNFNNSNSPLNTFLHVVAVDSNNSIWFGTTSKGAIKYSNGNWTEYDNIASNLNLGQVLSLFVDKNNNKYFGTFLGGVFVFNNKTWMHYDNTTLADSIINSIYIDSLGNQYYGTNFGGISKFNGKNWENINTQDSPLPYDYVRDISIMNDIKALIATFNGFAIFKNSNWKVFRTSNSDLKSNYIYSITSDKNNNILAATERGLTIYYGYNLITFTDASGLPHSMTRSVSVDSSNNIWVGTIKGAGKLVGNKWTVYNSSNSGLPGDYIRSIANDKFGNTWFGIWGKGLAKFDGENWETFSNSTTPLFLDYVNKIRLDKQSNVWLCTFGGLAKYDGTNWNNYYFSIPDFPSAIFYDVAFDKSGNVWAASNVGLIKIMNNNSFILYNTSNSGLTCNDLRSVAIDSLGNIWVGTYGGLSLFNQNGVVTAIKGKRKTLPFKFSLLQNYPNPFNPTTTIEYSIPEMFKSKGGTFNNNFDLPLVTLKIYDILGREVKSLVNKKLKPGNYSVRFTANNLNSGLYIYRLTVGNKSISKKMLLIK